MNKLFRLCASICAAVLMVNANAVDVTSNLVARWTFDKCNGVDATDGGHTGTLIGPARQCIKSPQKDRAFRFTGNYFQVPSSPDFNVDNALTYSVWIRPESFGNGGGIVEKYARGVEQKYLYLYTSGVVGFYLFNCMGNTDLKTVESVPLNVWTHIAATFDGSIAKIYVNGQLSNSVATTAACNPGDGNAAYLLGTYDVGNGPQYFYSGAMDDLRIYQRALRKR